METIREEVLPNGLVSIIRQSPGHRRGTLDPSVYPICRKAPELVYPADPDRLAEGDIEALRAQMGFPSRDLSDGVRVDRRILHSAKGEIPLSVYRCGGLLRPPPALFLHGGGFLAGSAELYDNLCKYVAAKARCTVIAPDYRLAPENPFPAGLDDCWETLVWVNENPDALGTRPGKVSVFGDSAGGTLAAACALRGRAEGAGRIAAQMLLYPCLNCGMLPTGEPGWDFAFYEVSQEPDLLQRVICDTKKFMEVIRRTYVEEPGQLCLPGVSPLLAADFHGLPPLTMICAEYDYLCPEDALFARKLADAGVASRLLLYKGVPHAFAEMLGIAPHAQDCLDEVCAAIRGTD